MLILIEFELFTLLRGNLSAMTLTLLSVYFFLSPTEMLSHLKKQQKVTVLFKSIVTSILTTNDVQPNVKCFNRIEMTGKEVVIACRNLALT